ncbi:MAG: hypothetical protein O2890_02030 [Cyanobacteria bacterium]|nr:hypothetical protein [Cyanobacteriota bacterium]
MDRLSLGQNMIGISKQIITNEAMEPVGVIIGYQDWQKIEAILADYGSYKIALGSVTEPQATVTAAPEGDEVRRSRGEVMALALAGLAQLQGFREVDPVAWQRQIRQDKPLPGRE